MKNILPRDNTLSRSQRLLGEDLLASAQLHPKKTALVVEGVPYTYAQLRDASLRLTSALRERGLHPGDRGRDLHGQYLALYYIDLRNLDGRRDFFCH